MRLSCVALIAIVAVGCAFSTEPHTSDVAFARARWLGFRPASYSFDLSVVMQVSSPGATRITVTNGQMTSAVDPSGKVIQFSAFTIDSLWAYILSARQNGTLNSAEFTMSGVPTDVDMGVWASDGGVHYAIRHFAVVH